MAEKTTILPITLELEDATLVKRVGSSSQGTVRTRIPFDLPALQEKWQGLSREVQHYRSRHAIATEIQTNDDKAYKEAARELGKALFKAIFTDAGEYQNSYALFKKLSPTRGSDKHLLLQLECNDPNVQALPWELLHHEGKFLALDKDFSLVRYIEQNNSKAVLDVPTPLRVLFVAANPQDCNRLELEQEYHQLQKLLRDAEINGIIELDHLFHATLPKLQEKLADDYYHVLHFAGHASHEGYLLFEDDNQQSKQISAEDLAPQLQNHRSLALVVLNACESGTASDSFTPFAGIAQKLAQRNIPAVLAMQLVISDPSAIRFSSNFYQDLSRDGDVGKALTNARVAIQSSSSEWLTPVLYSRADDLCLLHIREATPMEKAERVVRIKEKIIQHMDVHEWQHAQHCVAKLKVMPLEGDDNKAWLKVKNDTIERRLRLPEEIKAIEQRSKQGHPVFNSVQSLLAFAPDDDAVQRLKNNIAKQKLQAGITLKPDDNPKDEGADVRDKLEDIVDALEDKLLVFVLGAEVYQNYAQPETSWENNDIRPPNEAELGKHLMAEARLEEAQYTDLNHIAQRLSLREGRGEKWLGTRLKRVLNRDYRPNALYELLTSLSQGDSYDYYPIVLCHTLDDALIRHLQKSEAAFDVLEPDLKRGYFLLNRYENESKEQEAIINPEAFIYKLGQRPLIIKMNGYIKKSSKQNALITEDHHIDKVAANLIERLPSPIISKLREESSFLFLGLTLDNWKYRGVFKKIWRNERPENIEPSWTVAPDADEFNQDLWRRYNVSIIPSGVPQFVKKLRERLGL